MSVSRGTQHGLVAHETSTGAMSRNGLHVYMGIVSLCLCCCCAACGQAVSVNAARPLTSPTAGPQARHCGAIITARGAKVANDPDAPAKETCFAQAYATCFRADLSYTTIAVDVGTIHTFMLQVGEHGCMITDTTQGYSANFHGPHGPLHRFTCAGLMQQSTGLLIKACATENDVLIPV